MNDRSALLARIADQLEQLNTTVQRLVPPAASATDWNASTAYRWRRQGAAGWLVPVSHPAARRLEDLHCVERQKRELNRNTLQFLRGLPANNALLWGSRGTGKSSLVKALLGEHAAEGLRLIEVDRQDLVDLPQIVELLYSRPERFVVYCDDLSFEANDPSYKALKVVLDGSISETADNVVIYATSNRRHLMPETMQENRDARAEDGEIHPGEATEEKIALSDRFGLWLSFYPFRQDDYLAIAAYWLERLGVRAPQGEDAEWRRAALQWALGRGSRSGRTAWQFARDWAGRTRLEGDVEP